MFLKVSKTPNIIYCKKDQVRKPVRIGTKFTFAIVESFRSGKKTGHKMIASLGSYTVNEYEPINRGGGITGLGTQCIETYVKSFDLEDTRSFRKIKADRAFRFYHGFARKLTGAAAKNNIPTDLIKKIVDKAIKTIPLYSTDDYSDYIKLAAQEKIKKECSGINNKSLEQMIGKETIFDVYDYVILEDGLLKNFKNTMKLHISYGFEFH